MMCCVCIPLPGLGGLHRASRIIIGDGRGPRVFNNSIPLSNYNRLGTSLGNFLGNAT